MDLLTTTEGVDTSASLRTTGRAQRHALQELFAWRGRTGFGAIEAVVLAIYVLVLGLTLPYHEPWTDEAQAWLIARDSSFWEIFRYRLHYEGAPPLWHFLLHTLHLMQVPWAAIPYCGAVCAVAGIYVWLRWSPLPAVVRYVFPFTFFLQYQYAVVARSYVLFPLLLFLLCVLYRSRRVVLFTVVAGLLASLCMQGAVVSGMMVLLFCWERFRRRRVEALPARRTLYGCAALLVVLYGLTVYSALPAPDEEFALRNKVNDSATHQVLMTLVGETAPNHPGPIPPDFTPEQWKQMWDRAVPPKPELRTHAKDWLAWELRSPATMSVFSERVNAAVYTGVELLSELFWPIARSNVLAILFCVVLGAWAVRHGVLRYLVPAAVLLVVGEFLWVADHHTGMLLITIFAGIWLAATDPVKPLRRVAFWDDAFFAVATLVLVLQVGWTVHSVRADRTQAYDPSAETARYLKSLPAGTTMVAFHFWATGIEPYFERTPFANRPSSYWQWCSHVVVDAIHREVLAGRPDVVVYSWEDTLPDTMRDQVVPLTRRTGLEPPDGVLVDLQGEEYRETHRFCGERFARLDAAYRTCDVIYEPAQ